MGAGTPLCLTLEFFSTPACPPPYPKYPISQSFPKPTGQLSLQGQPGWAYSWGPAHASSTKSGPWNIFSETMASPQSTQAKGQTTTIFPQQARRKGERITPALERPTAHRIWLHHIHGGYSRSKSIWLSGRQSLNVLPIQLLSLESLSWQYKRDWSQYAAYTCLLHWGKRLEEILW